MIRTFRAQKMLDRIAREGKQDLLDDKTRDFILSLDGEPAQDYNWQRFVHGDPVAWIEKTDKHEGAYVNICDCDD